MTASTSPTNLPPGDGAEEIDRLLGAFFRAEVPSPWPEMKAPVATPARDRDRGRRPLRADRLALAASVAALLAGGWLLSGRLPSLPPDTGSMDNDKATLPQELRRGARPLPTMPSNRHQR
jgi:hypothetical protein